jgi:hypothetical protein
MPNANVEGRMANACEGGVAIAGTGTTDRHDRKRKWAAYMRGKVTSMEV